MAENLFAAKKISRSVEANMKDCLSGCFKYPYKEADRMGWQLYFLVLSVQFVPEVLEVFENALDRVGFV